MRPRADLSWRRARHGVVVLSPDGDALLLSAPVDAWWTAADPGPAWAALDRQLQEHLSTLGVVAP